MLPALLGNVIDSTDVGMGHLPCDANLVKETLEFPRILSHGMGKELEGHCVTELEVVCAIDFAHSSFAEQADDTVATGEHRAGCEACIIYGIGGR